MKHEVRFEMNEIALRIITFVTQGNFQTRESSLYNLYHWCNVRVVGVGLGRGEGRKQINKTFFTIFYNSKNAKNNKLSCKIFQNGGPSLLKRK